MAECSSEWLVNSNSNSGNLVLVLFSSAIPALHLRAKPMATKNIQENKTKKAKNQVHR